jgi:hypothetical protein
MEDENRLIAAFTNSADDEPESLGKIAQICIHPCCNNFFCLAE